MERTVGKGHLEVLDRETCQHAVGQGALEASLRGLDELGREDTTLHFVDKLQSLHAVVGWTHSELDIGKLSLATGLFFIDFTMLNCLSKGFLVRDLRTAGVDFNAKLSLEAVQNNVKVQFAHTCQYGLARIFIGVYEQRRIFLDQLGQGLIQLV